MANTYLHESTVERLVSAVKRCGEDPTYLTALSGAGPTQLLESIVSQYLEAEYVMAVSSGTAALHCALVACGIGPGDEVIVPSYTWPQTVSPIHHMGAIPVFVDVCRDGLTIDPHQVVHAITEKTRAILGVHLYGRPFEAARLAEIADANGLWLIEDAAHAFGASIGSQKVGGIGHVGCFSLGRQKPFTGGEGGLFVTHREDLFERAIAFSQHPIRQKFELGGPSWCGPFGMNYRIHPLAAVIAAGEFEFLESSLALRADEARHISGLLEDRPGVLLPSEPVGIRHAWYRYHIQVEDREWAEKAHEIMELRFDPDPIGRPLPQVAQENGIPHRTLPTPITDQVCLQTGWTVSLLNDQT